MNERLTHMIIAKRKHGLGEYSLSIQMDRRHLYIHEVLWNKGGWNICEGLWIQKSQYPELRNAYVSLKEQRYAIACVQNDRIQTFTNVGYSHISVERIYVVRQDHTWCLHAVNSVALHSITMDTQDLDAIMQTYEQYLDDLPERAEEVDGNDIFNPPV